MSLDSNGLTIGRYRLVERIAAGGMGEVYVALQTGIGRFSRPIAVKLLLPHLADDPRAVSMFLTEARIGAQMTHANIAQVYDVGLERDRYFIAMELVRGVALQKLIAGLRGAQQSLSLELFCFIARSLCDGLHVAHEQLGADGQSLNLVHRDVTPHNVLIGVDGAVKLTDFGIARVADADRLSRPGVVLGKLGYLAPEQILGAAIDRRTDVFAVGATLYHLAALEKPFDTPTGSTLDPERVPTVPLRVLRPDLPREVSDTVERALATDPAKRFQTAKELRNALPVPGPDAAEALGQLVRSVCAAALVDLERKTERATHAVDHDTQPSGADTRPPTTTTPMPRAGDSHLALPPLKNRTPFVVLGVLATSGLLALGWALWPSEATEPVVAMTTPAEVPDAALVVGPKEPRPAVDAGEPSAVVVAPMATAPGLLTIEASPWAKLTLDGRDLGETPRADVPVSPGVHQLVATCPDTGKTVRRRLNVVSGRPLQIRLDLR